MVKYSINALCMIEWSTIPFSKIGWNTELMCRKTEAFCRPRLEITSTNLKKLLTIMNMHESSRKVIHSKNDVQPSLTGSSLKANVKEDNTKVIPPNSNV